VQAINGLLRGIAFLREAEPLVRRKRAKKVAMAAAGSSTAGTPNKKAGARPGFSIQMLG
jgi:hypothetical protein